MLTFCCSWFNPSPKQFIKRKDKYLCTEYTDTASHPGAQGGGWWGRQHFSLRSVLIPGMVLGRRMSSQEHSRPAPISIPASARLSFSALPPLPPTSYKGPQDLRLRRGSCPLGHVPMSGRGNIHHWTPSTWEREGTPLERERQAPKEVGGSGDAHFTPLNKEDLISMR